MTKLPNAKSWEERHINDWNALTFTEYLKAKHLELFGVSYAPFGGTWSMEQGILGTLIGTQSRKNPKPRTASNENVKRFIDETFESYTPNRNYPGTSFGFMWTYRKNDWQRIEAGEVSNKRVESAIKDEPSLDTINEWL